MPTKTEGGLEPLIKSEEKRLPYFDIYSFQFVSIALRISAAVRFMKYQSTFYLIILYNQHVLTRS